jgi:predicted LPLAT superfamily acyltransferase
VLGRPARLLDIARHIHCFAATLLDRVYLLSDEFRRYDMRVEGVDELHQAIDQGRGVLLLGSHLGSFDALRVLSQRRPDVSVRVVLDRGQNPIITELLSQLNPTIAAGVIDAGQPGTAIVLAIKEAAEQGAVIGLLADRARPGESALPCRFMGADAPFPVAPMLIASALKIPVVLCFGLYRGARRYDLTFEPFADEVVVPRARRKEVLAELIQRYASRLEHHARLAPFNWFNFYDFWQEEHAEPEPPLVAVAGDRGLDGSR